MRFGAATLITLSDFPTTEYPSDTLALCKSVAFHIGANDTVLINSSHGVPSFVGRVTHVATSTQHELMLEESTAFHPFITDGPSRENYLRINVFLPNTDAGSEWPVVPPGMKSSVNGIPEVALTNCVVWCSPKQVSAIVLVPHVWQCVNQTYGQMCGRSHTYFIRYKLLFGDHHSQFDISEARYPSEHTMLGDMNAVPNHRSPSTATMRVAENLHHLSRLHTSLLTKSGRVNYATHSKMSMMSESWNYLLRRCSPFPNDDVKVWQVVSKTKQCITHLDLTLVTKVLETKRHFIRAVTHHGFSALRTILPLIGIGAKKRHPPISSIGMGTSAYYNLQSFDTINICDVGPDDFCANNHDEWFDDGIDLNRVKPSMIQFTFDHRLQEFRLSIRCCSVVVSACDAVGLQRYLTDHAIGWDNQRITPGTEIEIDNDIWVVTSVGDNEVALRNSFEDTRNLRISLNECLSYM